MLLSKILLFVCEPLYLSLTLIDVMHGIRLSGNDPVRKSCNTGNMKVGEIGKTSEETAVKWKIPNFSSLSIVAPNYYHSEDFQFFRACWRLQIYPNGNRANGKSKWISLYLVRVDAGPPQSFTYIFYVKTPRGKEHHFLETAYFGKKDLISGCSKFLQRSDLKLNVPTSGTLTLICRLKYNGSDVVSRIEDLSLDFKKLLLSTEYSDAKAVVQKIEFPLHRVILGARTPVFNSMFKHEMQEKETGVVHIDDCDPDVFRAFLEYIYSGAIQNFTPQIAIGLYEVADKYQVSQLKHDCLMCMWGNLSVDSFCDVLVLAVRHEEQKLLEVATEFFMKNTNKIIKTPKWLNYMRENAVEANKLVMKVLLSKGEKKTKSQ